MRTTLTIDDDVLTAAKGLAARRHKSVGAVISELARRALCSANSPCATIRNDIFLLPISKDATPVTSELVAQLDEVLT